MIRWIKERARNSVYWAVRKAVADEIREALDEDASHLMRCIHRQATAESARFVMQNFALHRVASDRYTLMNECLKHIPAEGLVLEFGVWKGNSIRNIAGQLPDRPVFGFDSFEGLDEPWIITPPGAFSDVEQLPKVPANTTLVKGWFQETLPRFLEEHPGPVALLHIDSDLHSSCKYVLETIAQRLVPGSVIVFDEFYNYPGWQEGEYKAFRDWQEATGAEVEYLGYTARPGIDWSGNQVGLKVKGYKDRANGLAAASEAQQERRVG